MKITIGNKTYTEIKNLNFAPETDITSSEAVINEFSVDIMTDDEIEVGGNAYLYDDLDNLWAKYWVIEAVRKNKQTLTIEAQSILRILDRKTMDAVMYSNATASSVISSIFSGLTNEYTLDSYFDSKRISGYCPKQSARQRLQWVCFCIGAYLKTFFADKILILPVNTTAAVVPMDRTFWKPSITYGDTVTAIQATVYRYVKKTPASTDKWVQIGEDYYVQTTQDFTITNPLAPVTANENVVSVSDVTIINDSNVSEVLTLLSTYYFKRMEVDADIINNAEYAAGDKITIPIDEENFVSGYIKSEAFTFGLQAKSKVKLMQTDLVGGAILHIIRKYGDLVIGTNDYSFPLSYVYTIQNPYIDLSNAGGLASRGMSYTRTIYLPLQPQATGTMDSEEVTDIENYDRAVVFYGNYKDNSSTLLIGINLLYILSVDNLETVTEDGKVIVEVD